MTARRLVPLVIRAEAPGEGAALTVWVAVDALEAALDADARYVRGGVADTVRAIASIMTRGRLTVEKARPEAMGAAEAMGATLRERGYVLIDPEHAARLRAWRASAEAEVDALTAEAESDTDFARRDERLADIGTCALTELDALIAAPESADVQAHASVAAIEAALAAGERMAEEDA